MGTAVPFRFRTNKTPRAIAAPAAFALIATRPIGADRCEVLLRGTIEVLPSEARRHAVLVLDALAHRHPIVDVQVLNAATGCPVLIVTAGGAA